MATSLTTALFFKDIVMYQGFVKTNDGKYFVQVENEMAHFGYVLTDGKSTYEQPPCEWFVRIEPHKVPNHIRDKMEWLIKA